MNAMQILSQWQDVCISAMQILAVALLSGKMHYCADAEDGSYLNPYYVLPKGEILYKDWWVWMYT